MVASDAEVVQFAAGFSPLKLRTDIRQHLERDQGKRDNVMPGPRVAVR